MQRIIISENDLTSNVELLSSYDVAYVPGLRNSADNEEYYHKPILFTDQYKFRAAIGSTPAAFTTDYPYNGNFSTSAYGTNDTNAFSTGDIDPGYRIAEYLLSLGIPVYYEVMNSSNSSCDAKDVYSGLFARFVNEDQSEDGLSFDSPGDYSVKFITSGGYPTFEHSIASSDKTATTSNTSLTSPITVRAYKGTNETKVDLGDDDTYDDAIGVEVKAILSNSPKNASVCTLKSNGTNVSGVTVSVTDNTVIFTYNSKPAELPSASTMQVTYTYTKAGTTNAITEGMLSVASDRGDAIALIDHTNFPNRPLTGDGSVIEAVRQNTNFPDAYAKYGAMFTPWYECSNGHIAREDISDGNNFVPASVGYLSALAFQIRDYNPWLAVSGTTRGKVPSLVKLHTGKNVLSNNIADSLQVLPNETISGNKISINPITYIRNVGYCIWGNRTLQNNANGTTATSFLNIRSTVSDIKKFIYETSQSMLFEQNTEITWLNFKSTLTPLLDKMVSNFILEDYSVVRYLVNPESGEDVPAYKVLGVISIRPYNSIEVFEFTVQIENTSTAIEEM